MDGRLSNGWILIERCRRAYVLNNFVIKIGLTTKKIKIKICIYGLAKLSIFT